MSSCKLFTNPVIAEDCPDPGVNRIGDRFFLVATGGGPHGAFKLMQSDDLVHWENAGGIFTEKNLPAWSGGAHGQACDYWAPEIHIVAGKIAVFFSAREPDSGDTSRNAALHVGVATSDSPHGPYFDSGRPLVSDPHWAIDPSYFLDEETGKQYLLWKVDGNAHGVPSVIKMQELQQCGTRLEEHSDAVSLIRSDKIWEGGVVEGPWLMKRGRYFYLFYSGECYDNHRYCVGVARSESIGGPFVKAAAPVLSSGRGWAGPGHCVVLATERDDVMVYHAWPSDTAGGRGSRVGERQVLVDRVKWIDGWPVVGDSGTPTAGPQPCLSEPVPARCLAGTVKLQVSQGWDAFLGYDGRINGAGDLFRVLPGLCPGGTVSLEAVKRPKHFLRHRRGRLELGCTHGDALFELDASFMRVPGLAGAGISLRSVNFPDDYVRHQNSKVFIHRFEDSELFLQDATWIPRPES